MSVQHWVNPIFMSMGGPQAHVNSKPRTGSFGPHEINVRSRPCHRRVQPNSGGVRKWRWNLSLRSRLAIWKRFEQRGNEHQRCNLPLYRADPRIHCLEVILEPLLVFGLQADELNPHANSGVTASNENTRGDPLFPDPQVRDQTCSNCCRQDGLHVAATGADVGCGDAGGNRCPLVMQCYDDRYLVTFPPSAA